MFYRTTTTTAIINGEGELNAFIGTVVLATQRGSVASVGSAVFDSAVLFHSISILIWI